MDKTLEAGCAALGWQGGTIHQVKAEAARIMGGGTPSIVREGQSSPWGRVQSCGMVAPGIGWVSTASHGGIKLDRKRNAEVPEYMRTAGGWYEEDCEWAIPYVVHEASILLCAIAKGDSREVDIINSRTHKACLERWHKAEHDRFYGVEAPQGE